MAPRLKRPVCIYIDNSNIYIGGKELAMRKGENPLQFRISFKALLNLICNNNPIDEIVWGGSVFRGSASVWLHLRKHGIKPVVIPRALHGEHETVDHALQLAMYRNARKYRRRPGTIILCTGDGKGYSRQEGFLYDLAGFAQDGWQVVLASWEHKCNRKLKAFVRHRGWYINLTRHYNHITYLKGVRNLRRMLI